MFVLLPARAKPEHHASVYEVVQSRSHVGENRWVAIGVAGYEGAKTHSGNVASKGSHGDPTFVHK